MKFFICYSGFKPCGKVTSAEWLLYLSMIQMKNGITINSNVDKESISMQKGLSNVFVRRVGT